MTTDQLEDVFYKVKPISVDFNGYEFTLKFENGSHITVGVTSDRGGEPIFNIKSQADRKRIEKENAIWQEYHARNELIADRVASDKKLREDLENLKRKNQ